MTRADRRTLLSWQARNIVRSDSQDLETGNLPGRAHGFFEPLAARLGLGLVVLVVLALGPGFWFFVREHYEVSLEQKRREAVESAKLIALSLRHEMLERTTPIERPFINRLVRGYATQAKVRRVFIVDHHGYVPVSSDESLVDEVFGVDDPSCQSCHADPNARQSRAMLFEIEGGSVLRTVHPVENEPACHACHQADHSINGLLVTDTDVTPVKQQLRSQVLMMSGVLVGIAVLILGGAMLLVRQLALRPLHKMKRTVEAIGAGEIKKRVSIAGGGAIARLGAEFNLMAESIAGLLSELSQQQAKLENVMNSVNDGLIVLDRDLRIVAANDPLAARLSTSKADLSGRPCHDIWGEDCNCTDPESQTSCPAKLCFASGSLEMATRKRVAPDGTERQEEVFASPVIDEDGHVIQVVEVWRDITERQSREARLAEFQRLASLGLLASGFSHEINTPLGTMLFAVDDVKRLLRQRADENNFTEIRKQTELIREEILRCRSITQQFLSFARGQSLKMDMVGIPDVVRGTVRIAQHAAREAGVTLKIIEGEERPVVVANSGAVQQVILNILINAIQASPENSEVRVGWCLEPDIAIFVSDDGIGMDREAKARALEPFFTRRADGTGLGLFVSVNLARQWGGDIKIDSEKGQGSIFFVTFPDPENRQFE